MFLRYSLSECKTGTYFLIRLLIFGNIKLQIIANKIRSLACCLGFIYLVSALDNLETSLKDFSTTLGLHSLAIK